MALSIKTEEADRLARELSRLTGETMTETVTKSLQERLERHKRVQPKRRTKAEVQEELERMNAFLEKARTNFDFTKPITKEDYDELCGDNDIVAAMQRVTKSR